MIEEDRGRRQTVSDGKKRTNQRGSCRLAASRYRAMVVTRSFIKRTKLRHSRAVPLPSKMPIQPVLEARTHNFETSRRAGAAIERETPLRQQFRQRLGG